MNKEEEFCRTYQATVQPGCRQYYRQTMDRWELSNHISEQPSVTTVDGVEINMPKDRFYALLEVEQRLRSLMNPKNFSEYHPGEQVWDEYVKECTIRNECPSVQIAYEKYLNLLNLVKSGYG